MIKVKFYFMHVNRHDDPVHPDDYKLDKNTMEFINKYHIPNQDYIYKDLVLTCEEDCDYAVILDHCFYKDFFDKSKTILFRCEPNLLRKNFPQYINNINIYSYMKTYEMWGLFEGLENALGINDALLGGYKFNKTKVLSSIISNLNWTEMHRKRLEFLYRLDTLPYHDHYGYEYACVPTVKFDNIQSHRGSIDTKWDGMGAYKYHFNADNVKEPDSFSERITQSLLAECLLFYDGCVNLEHYIDERAFIKVDIGDPDRAMHIIQQSIENDEYSRRYEFIKQEKQKVLDNLNLMECTYRAIHGIKNYWEV